MEYRDKAHSNEWKRSYGVTSEEIFKMNRIVGYEKYRVRIVTI